jgi:hypothetical protein
MLAAVGLSVFAPVLAGAQAVSWTQLSDSGPLPRYEHAMAFDSVRGMTVLFGGGAETGTMYDETWEWNSSAWTRRTPDIHPRARICHAMAFDSARRVTVLFGGYTDRLTRETWEWDGTNWTLRSTTGPLARYRHAMAYDSARGVMVLFGGLGQSGSLGDTWEWNGTVWDQRAVSGPSPRVDLAMAYDSARAVTVLFGGSQDDLLEPSGETWEWAGTAWALRSVSGPSARAMHAMAYDSHRAVMVLFGGTSAHGQPDDTWGWNGTAWATLAPAGSLPRLNTAMVFDTNRAATLLFGGEMGYNIFSNGTWELGDPQCLAPSINSQPVSPVVTLGSTASMLIETSGTSLTYQWMLNETTLADSHRISGANSHTLMFSSTQWSDQGSYTCRVVNECGSATSSSATLSITSCPASAWVPGIPTSATQGTDVRALAVMPDGDLIVAGAFSTIGGVAANRIARYNPTTRVWSALGAGLGNAPYKVAVLPDGDVIAAGPFTQAGDIAVNHIARFNPATGVWSALGAGTTRPIGGGYPTALGVLPGGDLLVGGAFATAGDVPADNIARYNPTTGTWSALGLGTNSLVTVFAVLPEGDVIVGGGFTTAGGVAANNIARYNPVTGAWSALGSGTNTSMSAIEVLPGGDLIVAGAFTMAGGVAANHIARYNLASGVWSALGSGTRDTRNSGSVSALAVLPGGDVIVGGSFTMAGDVWASRIARYNPSTGLWSALGDGVGPHSTLSVRVSALTVLPGGDVVVGGYFTSAGDLTTSNIARYSPGVTAPSFVTQPQNATACISTDATLSVIAAGDGPFAYEWRKDAVVINTSANVSAASPTLTLANIRAADVGSYDCIVTTACDSAISNSATLTVCIGDFDCDGSADGADIGAFFDAWEGGNDITDVNADGGVDGADVSTFFSHWEAGC